MRRSCRTEARLWPVPDLAASVVLQPDDAARILHRYATAGIVEEIDAAKGGRYR